MSRTFIPGYHNNHVIRTYDAVVIGAGVFGSWTALQLARGGARVLIVDQHGPANSRSSSGGETRILRMSYGADEIYTRSALRSLDLWKRFFDETGENLFHPCGALFTAPAKDAYLQGTRDTLKRVGWRFDWLDRADLKKHFPQMTFGRAEAGIYEPGSGILMARRSVQAVVEAAVRAGARYETRAWHDLPRRGAGGVFVFACGPWLRKLFPDVVGPRIRPTRQEVFFFGTAPGDDRFARIPAWVAFGEGAYAVPAIDGRGFKIAMDAHGALFDPETGDRNITRDGLAFARAVLKKRFPALAGAPLVESRVCQYENTSNGDFLIDRHPEFPNVWIAGGGSGHGFKHGPFVGEYVAAQIAGTGAAEPRFSLASKRTRHRRSVF
ncbi:MAG TPA: FAD-dependent oxidoreductase [Bryobacteraceae bacterium]|nr:FAD-dependent oxidoreductase [Bryobacteraceae bacterium]